MPPSGGPEPAHVADVWLRVLTDKRYWTKDNELHYKIFSGSGLARPDGPADHSLEISGRGLSKTRDIAQEAKAFCGKRPFVGHIFQTVENLRSEGIGFVKAIGCRSDVLYTPEERDAAHSDLVFYGPTGDYEKKIIDWLQEFIQFAAPDKCNIIESMRGRVPK